MQGRKACGKNCQIRENYNTGKKREKDRKRERERKRGTEGGREGKKDTEVERERVKERRREKGWYLETRIRVFLPLQMGRHWY